MGRIIKVFEIRAAVSESQYLLGRNHRPNSQRKSVMLLR